ncbi:MAG: RsmE family RNA methyltransferase, partial [Clostridia bacterium]
VVARITGALPACESPLRVTVYQGLPKADKLETLAQKLTELGVCALAPVRMARSVVKLDAREGEKKCERLRRIALEAVKQCGRARVMQVERVLGWDEALEQMRAHALLRKSPRNTQAPATWRS